MQSHSTGNDSLCFEHSEITVGRAQWVGKLLLFLLFRFYREVCYLNLSPVSSTEKTF